jgi:hypothetical protein
LLSRLELDAHKARMNGVALESSAQSAVTFGPASQILGTKSDPVLGYPGLGLEVECYQELIVGFRVIMDPRSRGDLYRRWQPAVLDLRSPNGASHVLSPDTHERQMFALLGRPVETGPVVGDRVHTFVVRRCLILSFHAPDTGLLTELLIESPA